MQEYRQYHSRVVIIRTQASTHTPIRGSDFGTPDLERGIILGTFPRTEPFESYSAVESYPISRTGGSFCVQILCQFFFFFIIINYYFKALNLRTSLVS